VGPRVISTRGPRNLNNLATWGTIPMPIPFPVSYSKLCILAVNGKLLSTDIICPKCQVVGRLFFTSSWVLRGIIWYGKYGILIFEKIKIPLVICHGCKGRFRVLPEEILPYKHFSLPAIEDICRGYVQPDPDDPGLRKYVDCISGVHPHSSTVHRWTEGLGERVLDRFQPGSQKVSSSKLWLPSSALVSESAKRINPGALDRWRQSHEIPSWKYHSSRRHDQLQACARLFDVAGFFFPNELHPLTAWQGEIIEYFNVAGWWFPTGYNCTGLQHAKAIPDEVISFLISKTSKKEMNHGSRSPPDGLVSF